MSVAAPAAAAAAEHHRAPPAAAVRAAAASQAAGGGGDSSASTTRLAILGDIHGQWSAADVVALQALDAVDAVLVVGDIGNEDAPLVQQIATQLEGQQLAVILGNHDAWLSLTAAGRSRRAKSSRRSSPPRPDNDGSSSSGSGSGPSEEEPDGVQQQLDALGSSHVGYAARRLLARDGTPSGISVVGGRPFSKGGGDWGGIADFMSRFGVDSMRSSADAIVRAAAAAQQGDALVLLAHNGPAGLGGEPHSICGVDWLAGAGDHGDPDLALALQELAAAGRPVALCVHGHMHHTLRGGGRRQMLHVGSETVVLNAATVPRVVHVPPAAGAAAPHTTRHHFLVVDLVDGVPACAADVWVQVEPVQQGQQQQAADGSGSQQHPDPSQPAAAAATGQEGAAAFCAAVASATHSRQAGSSKDKRAAAAARLQALEAQLQLQRPVQMQLAQAGPRLVDGCWRVHVAEVYEVLRTTSGGSRSWFDAHSGSWQHTHAPTSAVLAESATS